MPSLMDILKAMIVGVVAAALIVWKTVDVQEERIKGLVDDVERLERRVDALQQRVLSLTVFETQQAERNRLQDMQRDLDREKMYAQ